jgi:thiol-disulfide isomerase/thioredoxin
VPRLVVVVGGRCPPCREAADIAHQAAIEFPALAVEIINLDEGDAVKPEVVFAVPTFLLNGRIVSLGNPSIDDLRRRIGTILANIKS